MDQKRAHKGLAQPHAWYTDDVRASPEHGEAYELAGQSHMRAASQVFESTQTRASVRSETQIGLAGRI